MKPEFPVEIFDIMIVL